jgi:hypothetical protein
LAPGASVAWHPAHCFTELWPQLGQKRAPPGTSDAHFAHLTAFAVPHPGQAGAGSGTSAPHFAQQAKARPQLQQNLEGFGVLVEQTAQAMTSCAAGPRAVAHCGQNFAPGALADPHFGHAGPEG